MGQSLLDLLVFLDPLPLQNFRFRLLEEGGFGDPVLVIFDVKFLSSQSILEQNLGFVLFFVAQRACDKLALEDDVHLLLELLFKISIRFYVRVD